MNDTQGQPFPSDADAHMYGSAFDAPPEEPQSMVVEAINALDISGRMTRHPYQTMLIAAGVGYVLGGGLFTRLTGNMFRVGIRVGSHPLIQRELLGAAEALLRGRSNSSS